MLQNAFGQSCMNRASGFEWHKEFKEARESARDDERCGWSKEINRPELIGQKPEVKFGRNVVKKKKPYHDEDKKSAMNKN